MLDGRRRLHGGLSTGPKTVEGTERIRRAVTRHERYSAAVNAELRYMRELLSHCRAKLADIGRASMVNATVMEIGAGAFWVAGTDPEGVLVDQTGHIEVR